MSFACLFSFGDFRNAKVLRLLALNSFLIPGVSSSHGLRFYSAGLKLAALNYLTLSIAEMSSGGGGNSDGAGSNRKGYVDAIVPTVDPNADLPGLEVIMNTTLLNLLASEIVAASVRSPRKNRPR